LDARDETQDCDDVDIRVLFPEGFPDPALVYSVASSRCQSPDMPPGVDIEHQEAQDTLEAEETQEPDGITVEVTWLDPRPSSSAMSQAGLIDPILSEIIGEWSGYAETKAWAPMLHYIFEPSKSGGFECCGYNHEPAPFIAFGDVTQETDGSLSIQFRKQYTGENWYFQYTGALDLQSGEFSGTFVSVDEEPAAEDTPPPESVRFIMRRVSPDIMRHRPTAAEFRANKSIARWKFLRDVTIEQVRRNLWSTTYFTQRAINRKRCMDVLLLNYIHGDLTSAGTHLIRTLVPQDIRRYWNTFEKLEHWDKQDMTVDYRVLCDICGAWRWGPCRLVCVDCPRSERGLVDLCPTLSCINSKTLPSDRTDLPSPHLPSHGILRVPYYMHLASEGRLMLRARNVLNRADEFLEPLGAVMATGTGAGDSLGRRKAVAQTPAEIMPCCVICAQTAVLPCWYCADCEGDVILCNKCGVEEIHHDTHLLVRYSKRNNILGEAAESVEQQLVSFRTRTEHILQKMEDETTQKLRNVDEGINAIRVEMQEGLRATQDDVQMHRTREMDRSEKMREDLMDAVRSEMKEGLKTIRDEVQHRLDGIERLLVAIASASVGGSAPYIANLEEQ